ncbi:MAG: hypothetical protein ACPGEF_04800, partial [Endozoicomonas sp.]
QLIKDFQPIQARIEHNVIKANNEKIRPVYQALQVPITSFMLKSRRLAAMMQTWFNTLPVSEGQNGTPLWQDFRNQNSGFILTQEDPGTLDILTIGNREFDPSYSKRVKPHFTKLERENLPVEQTDKARIQQQVLRQYLSDTAKMLADLPQLYPDISFKNGQSSPSLNMYGGGNSNEPHTFNPSVVTLPNMLVQNRYAQYSVATAHDTIFNIITDDVLSNIDFSQIQLSRVRDNLQNLDQQTFNFLEVRGRGGHVLIRREIPMGALLRAVSGDDQWGKNLPLKWTHYSTEAKKQTYIIALQQLSGVNPALPIMGAGHMPLVPEHHPVISNSGHNRTPGLFYRDANNGLKQFKASSDRNSIVEIKAKVPWKPFSDNVDIFKISSDGELTTDSTITGNYSYGIEVKCRVTFNSDYITDKLAPFQSRISETGHQLIYHSLDNFGRRFYHLKHLSSSELNGHRAIDISNSEVVNFSGGNFILGIQLRPTTTEPERTKTIVLEPSKAKYSENHYLDIKGTLPAGDYVWQSSENEDTKAYMVVNSDEWSQPLESEDCQLSPVQPSSLLAIKQRVDTAITEVGGQYQDKWQEIFEQIINLEQDHSTQAMVDHRIIQYRFEPASTAEPVATNAHSTTQQPQAINNQSQSSGNHQ